MSITRSLANFSQFPTLRLRIDPLLGGDVSAFRRMTDDPFITDVVDFLPTPFTELDALKLLGSQDENNRFLGVWLGKELVGTVGIHLHGEDRLEVGYWFGTRYQGRGYAYEATAAVVAELRRSYPELEIDAECRLENAASWKLLQKLGFRPTGERGHRQGRELLVIPRTLPK